MRTTLTLFCILGASFAGFSQDKSFDLSKYKFPDYKRHELELNFSSSGESSRISSDITSIVGDESITGNDFFNSQFNSDFKLGYVYENFNRKRLDYLSSSFSGNYEYSKYKNQQVTNKSYNPEAILSVSGYRRYYLKEDKFFLEASTDLYYHFYESKRTYRTSPESKTILNNSNFLVGLGGGTGRMEKVSDFWQAYYILEKLKKQKTIIRELDEKDIFEFANHASLLKNKRFFDARLRKISELTTLDSLLHKKGLIVNSDISYFTTLNDYWSYGNFQDRESGKVLKIWFSPEYRRVFSKSNDNASDISTETNISTNLTFNCNKQLNLNWERNLSIWLKYDTMIDSTGKSQMSYPINQFYTGMRFGYGFYPDSRTSLKMAGGYSGYKGVYIDSGNIKEHWVNNLNLNFIAVYYLSPQLQLTGSFALDREITADKIYNRTSMRYNLGLRYAIF